ncbi:hypothetical protein PybrP1_004482 [[Pythium] brassicae (nom. inval.)]|nr:hypothetical protein PybrP1_004482 [[Pythium] brassicae (nom. inval.)]
MVSWGEIFLTVTAAGYLLGRKELLKMGRVLGVYSGRSVGAVLRAKQEFFDATKDSELVKLQQEFQKGIAELNEIRSELTSVGSMTRPLQPHGTAPPSGTVETSAATAAGAAGGAAGAYQHHSRSLADQAPANAPPAPGRSSLSLASMNYAELEDPTAERSTEASLAIAELKLAQQGKFAPRLETVEGGADYVSASIVDSLLLRKVQQPAKRK